MTEKWSDLAARMGSGLLMVLVGIWGIWMGGDVFHVLVALVCGLMVWELVRIVSPTQASLALQLGAVSGVAVLLAIYLPIGFALPILLAPCMVGLGQLAQNRSTYMIFTVLVLMAGFGIMQVRDDLGFGWMTWLVMVVVVTDVVGYFAGRAFGGPKFWPRVSPKKTWSGTVAGWIGAGAVGAVFAINTEATLQLIGVSVALSMASQMGDIGESAMKRRMGVKDSSSLIPGHGGVLDRFDGMLGASVFLLMLGQVAGFPGGVL
ncbi:phosphatidate cytidylyltransferase [Tateyamaria omphalii]|uniref:Phosphatidate cytidylyltransferase n=1 Tax=Tateyamaria omphalii TaxID=299262 RepID=A0A1P8MT94_9RHOB|nr:phosphatidate cytidylyltransferase [Tateyamaria omphalii]APX11306.1 phosphatidate cytidylyltransferase [Tateyamaria omphalii]